MLLLLDKIQNFYGHLKPRKDTLIIFASIYKKYLIGVLVAVLTHTHKRAHTHLKI